jgi:hypothetical protein
MLPEDGGISATPTSKVTASPQEAAHFDTNQFSLRALGTLPRHSVFVRCAAAIWVGILMKSAIAIHLPDEHFVIRVDGRVRSHHRRFLDALREGLQLRDQFPQHDVKVQSMAAESQQRTGLH